MFLLKHINASSQQEWLFRLGMQGQKEPARTLQEITNALLPQAVFEKGFSFFSFRACLPTQ